MICLMLAQGEHERICAMSMTVPTPNTAPGQSDNLKGAGFMLLAMATFTLSDACMKAVAEMMPLYQAVTLRGCVTLPILLLIGHFTGGLQFRRVYEERRLVGIRTFAEAAASVAFFLGLTALPLAIVTAILQATPLAVTAAAALIWGEKVGWRRLSAIIAGFCGVLLIVRPGSEGFNVAALWVLLSVCFVVMRDMSTRKLPKDIPSATVAFLAACGVMSVCFVISLREPWVAVPLPAMPIIVLSSVGVVAGYIAVIRAMRSGEVSFITPFRYSALLWALLLGWVAFGHFPDWITLLGACIVAASGIFTILRERRLKAGD